MTWIRLQGAIWQSRQSGQGRRGSGSTSCHFLQVDSCWYRKMPGAVCNSQRRLETISSPPAKGQLLRRVHTIQTHPDYRTQQTTCHLQNQAHTLFQDGVACAQPLSFFPSFSILKLVRYGCTCGALLSHTLQAHDVTTWFGSPTPGQPTSLPLLAHRRLYPLRTSGPEPRPISFSWARDTQMRDNPVWP